MLALSSRWYFAALRSKRPHLAALCSISKVKCQWARPERTNERPIGRVHTVLHTQMRLSRASGPRSPRESRGISAWFSVPSRREILLLLFSFWFGKVNDSFKSNRSLEKVTESVSWPLDTHEDEISLSFVRLHYNASWSCDCCNCSSDCAFSCFVNIRRNILFFPKYLYCKTKSLIVRYITCIVIRRVTESVMINCSCFLIKLNWKVFLVTVN